MPCAATSTDVLPISAPPVLRRITRTLTSARAARSVSLVTTPLRLPALAPAGSELICVTPTPVGMCRGRAGSEHRDRQITRRLRRA